MGEGRRGSSSCSYILPFRSFLVREGFAKVSLEPQGDRESEVAAGGEPAQAHLAGVDAEVVCVGGEVQ